MATQCWYCEEPISHLRRLAGGIHSECKKKYEVNLQRFEDALTEAATSDEIIDEAEVVELNSLIFSGKIRGEDRGKIGLAVYKRLHKQALDDGYILRPLTGMIEGDLPHITPSIILQKNEVSHLETTTRWCHLKTRRELQGLGSSLSCTPTRSQFTEEPPIPLYCCLTILRCFTLHWLGQFRLSRADA